MTEKKYEDYLFELQEIVRKIESDETGIEESLKLYERGSVLVSKCEKLLTEAEMKISEFTRERE